MTRVLYIAGYGRSGSTLFERLLATHPDLVGVGEIRNLPDLWAGAAPSCSCGLDEADCPVWGPATARLRPWRTPSARAGLARALARYEGWTRHTPEGWWSRDGLRADYLRFLGELYPALAEAAGARWVVESSKTDRRSLHRVALLREAGLDVTVIHLVRHPLGCAWSLRKGRNSDLEQGRVRRRRGVMLRLSASWTLANRAAEASAVAGPSLRVRYEDLVRDPEATLRRIGAAIDVDLEPVLTRLDAGDVPPAHQISGNRMRLRPWRALVPDEAWRTKLSPGDRRVVWALTGRRARRYGYAPDAPSPGSPPA